MPSVVAKAQEIGKKNKMVRPQREEKGKRNKEKKRRQTKTGGETLKMRLELLSRILEENLLLHVFALSPSAYFLSYLATPAAAAAKVPLPPQDTDRRWRRPLAAAAVASLPPQDKNRRGREPLDSDAPPPSSKLLYNGLGDGKRGGGGAQRMSELRAGSGTWA